MLTRDRLPVLVALVCLVFIELMPESSLSFDRHSGISKWRANHGAQNNQSGRTWEGAKYWDGKNANDTKKVKY